MPSQQVEPPLTTPTTYKILQTRPEQRLVHSHPVLINHQKMDYDAIPIPETCYADFCLIPVRNPFDPPTIQHVASDTISGLEKH